MADNTRVKKLARKLQAETGLRYTEALARVRLQGAQKGLEGNPMNDEQEVRPFHLRLGTVQVPPGEEAGASAASANAGLAKKLQFQVIGDAAAIVFESITVDAVELLVGPAPLGVFGSEYKISRPILVNPGTVVAVRLRNHGKTPGSVVFSVEGEDHTNEALTKLAELFAEAREEGVVIEGQYNGLGSVVIQPGERAALLDTCNHNMLVRRARFDAAPVDGPHPEGSAWALAQIQITAIAIGGSPVNLGSRSMSLGVANDLLGARPVLVGQPMVVTLYNPSDRAIIVSGGFLCDMLSPYWEQQRRQRDTPAEALPPTVPTPPTAPSPAASPRGHALAEAVDARRRVDCYLCAPADGPWPGGREPKRGERVFCEEHQLRIRSGEIDEDGCPPLGYG